MLLEFVELQLRSRKAAREEAMMIKIKKRRGGEGFGSSSRNEAAVLRFARLLGRQKGSGDLVYRIREQRERA